jgi:cytoskeleton protein RodZ
MSEVETRDRDRAVSPAGSAGAEPAPTAVRTEPTARERDGSFGRALAAAREARGLTQADIAAQMRLHQRQVKAIEEEDLAALPEGPFVRGYLRNYAKLVDLPAEPLLSLLNAKIRPGQPLRAGGENARAVSPIQRMPGEPVSGRLVIGGALVALVVFAAFGWWTMRGEQRQEAAASVESAPAVGATPSAPPPAASAEPSVATPDAATAEPAAAAAPSAATSEATLRLSFRDRSWVEVRQSDGAVLLSQNNAPGTVQTVDGLPPYTLVIGNASKVDLEFRGRPVDLSAATSRDDVARLRLE